MRLQYLLLTKAMAELQHRLAMDLSKKKGIVRILPQIIVLTNGINAPFDMYLQFLDTALYNNTR